MPLLREKKVEISGRLESGGWISALFISAFPVLLLIGFWVWSLRRFAGQGAEVLSFGRNKAKIYDQSDRERFTFADVAGVDEAKMELVEVVDSLKNPAKYQKLGGRIPKGILLVGVAWDGQDAAGEGGQRRGAGAVLLDLGLGVRRAVRGCGRLARA